MIKHKISNEVISNFPHYYKNGNYGFLTLTNKNEILFFYFEDDTINYTDLTSEFEIL